MQAAAVGAAADQIEVRRSCSWYRVVVRWTVQVARQLRDVQQQLRDVEQQLRDAQQDVASHYQTIQRVRASTLGGVV